ncbi:hypothetical protein EYR40_004701 [Pleurotus pulmonarius]|nr:hypothetical protein EYR40_004701 [Pleurotus pulmonarius]
MCTLPNDLLIPILEELAEDYKTLSTLLTVSRNIYALALPLFYQELDISRQGPFDDRDLHSVVQKLYHRIECNPGRQFTTSLRFDLWCFFDPLPDVRTVLPHLPNLRRLCILGPDPIGSDVLQLIPSTAQLTHLMLGRAFYEQSLLSFLELHPKLAFLCINHLRHDFGFDFDDPSQSHPTVPRSALPVLRSAEIPDDILRLIAGRASLVDLAITDAEAPSPPFSYDVAAAYPSVCSLSVQRISFSGTTSLVASLPNLRYMRVHVDPVTALLLSP